MVYERKIHEIWKPLLLLLLKSFVALYNDFSFLAPGLKYSKALNAGNDSITGSQNS